jgi:hypothetical protein
MRAKEGECVGSVMEAVHFGGMVVKCCDASSMQCCQIVLTNAFSSYILD